MKKHWNADTRTVSYVPKTAAEMMREGSSHREASTAVRNWIVQRSGPKAGTPEYAVQEAWIEMAAAGRDGTKARTDAAWRACGQRLVRRTPRA